MKNQRNSLYKKIYYQQQNNDICGNGNYFAVNSANLIPILAQQYTLQNTTNIHQISSITYLQKQIMRNLMEEDDHTINLFLRLSQKKHPFQSLFEIYLYFASRKQTIKQGKQSQFLGSTSILNFKDYEIILFFARVVRTSQLFDLSLKIMSSDEEPQVKIEEEQIMIMMEEVDQNEGTTKQDLLEMLVAEPTLTKKASLKYDYEPGPVPLPKNETDDGETTQLKTSNTSTSTAGEVRKCTCLKTRCLKNYCECFKQGLACTSECVCLSCCNRERLFLNRMNPQITKCKCQKSHCLKKYCECHNSGRKCGPACKCLECQNMEEDRMEVQDEEDIKMEQQICDHNVFLDI